MQIAKALRGMWLILSQGPGPKEQAFLFVAIFIIALLVISLSASADQVVTLPNGQTVVVIERPAQIEIQLQEPPKEPMEIRIEKWELRWDVQVGERRSYEEIWIEERR